MKTISGDFSPIQAFSPPLHCAICRVLTISWLVLAGLTAATSASGRKRYLESEPCFRRLEQRRKLESSYRPERLWCYGNVCHI